MTNEMIQAQLAVRYSPLFSHHLTSDGIKKFRNELKKMIAPESVA
jgi:hypothetical protein